MSWHEPLWLLALIAVGIIIRYSGLGDGFLSAVSHMKRPWKILSRNTNRQSKRDQLKNAPNRQNSSVSGNGALARHRLPVLTGLRVAAVAMAVLALAGTLVLLPSMKRHLVILIDSSASITDSQIEKAREAALQTIRRLNGGDKAAVAAFAGDCRLMVPFSAPQTAAHQLENLDLRTARPEQSDLKGALRFCKQLFEDRGGQCSILLCSDGRPTAGGVLDSAQIADLLGSGRIQINIIPIGLPAADIVTQALELPEVIRSGERIFGKWHATAAQTSEIRAVVRLDGRLTEEMDLTLDEGKNAVSVPLFSTKKETSLTPGIHKVELEYRDGHGTWVSAGAGLIRVTGPARILLIHGMNGSEPLQKSLAIQGIEVVGSDSAGIPDNLAGLAGYGAVILDNIPALDLTEDQQSAMKNYVAGGGGLLVIGGESSLGRGEYFATGLEDLLPVKTDTRQRMLFNRAHILFILDRSGSMSEMVGNTSKQMAAMKGIANSIQELNPLDQVGIMAFDVQPSWILPFTPVSRRAEILRSLSNTGEGGGTDMAAALREVVREFGNPGPERRHVIILSDGLTAMDDFKEICRKLRFYQATVSTIAIGTEINEKLLREIAAWGNGKFYRADLNQVPVIMKKETVRITRDLIQEGKFTPQTVTAAPFLEGVSGKTPSVRGYLITKPKELGTVYLQVGKGDPLLAGWRYGNGKVMVFTSDSGRRWMAPWSGQTAYNRLWSQIIRSIERGSIDQGLRVSTRVNNSAAKITVEAVGADERLRQGLELTGQTRKGLRFNFRETAPGRYESEIPMTESGLQQFQVSEKQAGSWTVGWVWNNANVETASIGPDLDFLKEIAAETGGKVFNWKSSHNFSKFMPPVKWGWEMVPLRNFLLIAALILFVTELAFRSTALGQLRMAGALAAGWWEAQKRLIERMRTLNQPVATNIEERVRTSEAYRYMAERVRRSREVSKDDQ